MARMGGKKSPGSVATAARTKARATTTRVTTLRAARRSGPPPPGRRRRRWGGAGGLGHGPNLDEARPGAGKFSGCDAFTALARVGRNARDLRSQARRSGRDRTRAFRDAWVRVSSQPRARRASRAFLRETRHDPNRSAHMVRRLKREDHAGSPFVRLPNLADEGVPRRWLRHLHRADTRSPRHSGRRRDGCPLGGPRERGRSQLVRPFRPFCVLR